MQAPDPAGIAAVADAALAWVRLARDAAAGAPARAGPLRLPGPRRPRRLRGRPRHARQRAARSSIAWRGRLRGGARSFDADALMPALTERRAGVSRVPLAPTRTGSRPCREAARDDLLARWGAPEADPALRRRGIPLPRRAGRKRPRRARSPTAAAARDRKAALPRPRSRRRPTPIWPSISACAQRAHRRADPSRHARHHRVAARQGRGALARLLAAARRRRAAGHLSLHRRRPRRGRARQAPARRAITLGHMTPPRRARRPRSPKPRALRELVEEYRPPQRARPAPGRISSRATILERAAGERARSAACGVVPDTPMERGAHGLDAHLCDLGEVAIRDGLHVFGDAPAPASKPARRASARAFSRALDGRFVPPGPAGSPSRGRPRRDADRAATFPPSTRAPSRPAPPRPRRARPPPR